MSGVRFTCRVSTADIADDFNRPNLTDIAGTKTPIGQALWERFRKSDATLTGGIVSQRIRATGGPDAVGNVAYLLNAGATDYDITYIVRDTNNYSMSPYVVFRGIDDQNHFAVSHRKSIAVPGYGIIRRLNGAVRVESESNVIPAPGDRVRIRVRAQVVEVFVNDTSIMTFTMAGGETRVMCGVLFVADDQVSSFDNFSIYRR